MEWNTAKDTFYEVLHEVLNTKAGACTFSTGGKEKVIEAIILLNSKASNDSDANDTESEDDRA